MKRLLYMSRVWMGDWPGRLVGVLLLAMGVFSSPAVASVVQGVQLDAKASEQLVRIDLDAPGEYRVYELENPPRVVIGLPGYSLAPGVRPLQGRDSIENVFPISSAEGARIEVGLKAGAKYTVKEDGNALLVAVAPQAPVGKEASGAVIKDVQVRDKGDATEVIIHGERMDANHNVFVTNDGRTMIIDFWDGVVKLPNEHFAYATRKVSSITVGQAEGRARLVVSLLPEGGVKHQIEAGAQQMVVRIGDVMAERRDAAVLVEAVDFRPDDRIAHLMVRTNRTDPIIDLKQRDGNVILDVKNSALAPGQERSQDVSAFPGPVKQVDSYQHGRDVRIVARLREKVDLSSFQSGNVLTVNLVPEDIASAKAVTGGEREIPYHGQKVSFNFKDIDIRNALKLIAEMSDLNIIMSDDVSGTLTMRLVDVPWDQALDLILSARGLGKEQIGNVLRIAPIEVLEAEYQSRLKAQEGSAKLEPLMTEFIQLSYAKVTDVKSMLEGAGASGGSGAQANQGETSQQGRIGILSPRGSFLVDERTNTLIVKDTEESINNIKRLIAAIDKPVEQVLIEARIVEATDNFSRDIGIRWGGQYNGSSGYNFPNTTTVGGAIGAIDPATGQAVTATGGNGFLVDLPAATGTGSGGAIGLVLGSFNNALNLNLELSAAEANNEVKIISNPRVVTTNMKKAVIAQGADIPFTSVSQNGTQTEFKKAVLGLEVTPQITADDRIVLDVTVSKDSPVSLTAANPSIETKNISTQIVMDNGETVVIGGIYTRNKSNGEQGVPLLKDIPLLGWLFKHKLKTDQRTELLIFLTPTIIKSKRHAMES